jgi:hypothetical protein
MTKPDPQTYAEMSKPHASLQEMNDAWENFRTELGELRKKHRIQDMAFVLQSSFLNSEGRRCGSMAASYFGDFHQQETLLAFGLGQARTMARERIACLLEGKDIAAL